MYSLKSVQKLPISLEEAWDFFSSPKNLKEITPDYMGFKVTSDPEFSQKAYPGQIITYIVTPILGIPMRWMTEITQVEEKRYFVDEQRFGPYSFWHHQHHFKAIEGGVEMTDLLHYKPPLGFIGSIANAIFIKGKINEIFDYRIAVLEKKFGKFPDKV
jgi:ligand-binding SRPBCC domain-containing protein